MAIIRIEYKTKSRIVSCLAGETELQAGEQVKIAHNNANPAWNEYIVAYLGIPAYDDMGYRVYLLDFDDSQLNGGVQPDSCDLNDPVCWSCCDSNADRLNNLISALKIGGVLTENEDGTFNYIN